MPVMAKRRAAAVALVASALGGCVAGPAPEIATPAPVLPETYLYRPSGAVETSLADLLPQGDAAFVRMAEVALAGSPTLLEAVARIDAARAAADRAGANRLPAVGIGGSVTGSRTNPDQFGANLPPGVEFDITRVQYGANVTASWDPDVFGRLRSSERASLALAEASAADRDAVRVALIAELAAATIDWRTLSAREASLRRDLGTATEFARLAGVREEAGLSPGFDRIRAEGTMANVQSRIDALAGEKARLLGRLVTLSTLDAGTIEALFAETAPGTGAPPPPATLPSDLLSARPDVRAAFARLAASDQALAATAASRFPSFDLSAVVGLLAFGIGGLFDTDAIVGSLGASVAAPLLDFGRIGAEIDGAAADKRAAFQRYRGAVYQALGDAESGYALVAATDREAASARTEAALGARQADLADTRYRAGLADFLTVLDARRTAIAANERADAAEGRASRARVLLWQALGGSESPLP
ncbi:efflux transporter outer membrane subunit [Alteriqipengyuania sp. WL0013]|uniref:efflux transporter outer membrane subunit n=1 Tax=Alteriqipengyuania sp. WL0013 TaxID=3110773 RepID=UPI002D00571A|nr:efflux transporter outer membrane subunit [Alteriqipengyuania sp. WL0013]MEB3416708.1 efflux transporter outer membrane subunit [Alteriqipengyuania sp. WL0013]